MSIARAWFAKAVRCAARLAAGGLLAVCAAANATTITSQASATFDRGSARVTIASNQVLASTAAPPTLHFYTDDSYTRLARSSALGRMLYLSADAQSCVRDPTRVEQIQIVLWSQHLKSPITVTATETAPGSGVFRAEAPTSGSNIVGSQRKTSANAVAASLDDTVMAQIGDCGGGDSIESQILIDPSGVVFDSVSDQALAGATLTLIDVAGAGNGGVPNGAARVFDYDGVTPLPSTAVTGADGRFAFPNVPPSRYQLKVTPPTGYQFPSTHAIDTLPATRELHPQASYGGVFEVSAATGAVTSDVPLDAFPRGLFVQLTSSRTTVEIGETVEYTVLVRNAGDGGLDHVDLQLSLPRGFSYVPGSARLDGVRSADPGGGLGPGLHFGLPGMQAGDTRTLKIRVRVGVQAPAGDGIARAVASSPAPLATTSNTASVQVKVVAGIFTDTTMVLGTVFADCNRNGRQDAGEAGVPGVRLLLEDGTFAVTDGQGRYSLYGLSAKTHVLKIDATTLPDGLEPLATSQRHAGDGNSRFVDPRRGELHRADFALGGCSAATAAAIEQRRAKDRELERIVKADFRADASLPPLGDTRGLPARGLVNAEAKDLALPAAAAPAPAAAAAARETALPERVAALDNTLAFIDLHDGQVLPAGPATLRVKGPDWAVLALEVNGVAVADTQVGIRLHDTPRDLQALEIVGVPLAAGSSTLTLLARDAFGNVRARIALTLRVAGPLARVSLVLPDAAQPADGRTLVPVRLELRDADGLPVTTRTAVTLQSSLGDWTVPDLDAREPGVQTFVEGGSAELALRAPALAGNAMLHVSAGALAADAKLRFVPELRPLIASGIVEGALNLRRLDPKLIHPAGASDGFETELRSFANGNASSLGGRAAMVLKGKVSGETLLTLAYDSDKDTHERLFRDIQPDQFYPVYGDSSVKGFDAQSTSRLYVRIDHDRSSLLYGDFVTGTSTRARQLGAYQRSLTGIVQHTEDERFTSNVFAARTNSRQIVDELPGNGTSGPYALSVPGLVENSEKVEILVRDRSQTSRVLRSSALQRFVDYELEPLTGRVLMRAPVPSYDPDLNPMSVRVSYEAEQGGADFWVGGADIQFKADSVLEVGAAVAVDRNPADPNRLTSANATIKASEQTTVVGEIAHVEHPQTSGAGDAQRVEIQHDGDALKLRAHAGRSSADFINPSSTLGAGRSESGLNAAWSIDERTRVVGEALRSADAATGGRRHGELAGVERSFEGGIKLEAGVRHVHDEPGTPGLAPTDTESARAKLGAPVPGLPAATAFGEVEQDLRNADKRLVALGGDYRTAGGNRVYARHEIVSSLAGPLALDVSQKRQTTLFGVDAETTKDGRVFSEYRLRDGLAGRDGEAAIGLRNQWQLAEGVRAQTGFERVHAVSGSDANENTALTGAIDYTRDPLWKGSARLEWREGATTRSLLSTLGLARKIDDTWTVLGRNAWLEQKSDGQPTRTQERLQLGLAWRDDTRSNGLARYEFKREDGSADVASRLVHQVSAHADVVPESGLTLTGQVAAKHVIEQADGQPITSNAQLVAVRATRDLGDRWDLGAALRLLTNNNFGSRAVGAGVEAGYRVAQNLWLSAGWNVSGFKDRDLTGSDATQKGGYLRLRFKFDESLFGAAPAKGRS